MKAQNFAKLLNRSNNLICAFVDHVNSWCNRH